MRPLPVLAAEAQFYGFCRKLQTASLQRAFSDAATAGRGGLVREVLTAQYPRLAQLLEDTITKLLQDTEVRPAFHHATSGKTLKSPMIFAIALLVQVAGLEASRAL